MFILCSADNFFPSTFSGLYADNAKVIIPDIGASNGVIHAVDKLLFPDDLRQELEQAQQQQSQTNSG